ncbi:hypothetical protein [Actinomadura syzygii]
MNMGQSKGQILDRVLIFLTSSMKTYLDTRSPPTQATAPGSTSLLHAPAIA